LSGGLRDRAGGVAFQVDAAVFLGQVVAPIFVEVAVADNGAELEDGFGAGKAPAGASDVKAVFDEMSAGALVPSSYCLSVHRGCVKQGVFGVWDQYS